MTSRGFTLHTIESAPDGAKPHLAAAAKQFGFLPSPMRLQAEAPLSLDLFAELLKAFHRASFTNLEQETIAFAVARHVGCEYCIGLHTSLLGRAKTPPNVVQALREGTPIGDARLDALDAFTRDLLARGGDPTEATWRAFLDAGYSRAQALEVVVGITAYTLSTFTNRLVQTPLDW